MGCLIDSLCTCMCVYGWIVFCQTALTSAWVSSSMVSKLYEEATKMAKFTYSLAMVRLKFYPRGP